MSDGEASANHTAVRDDRTALAISRTIAAYNRTLMASIRTGTSLISFGFSIHKFFEALNDRQLAPPSHLVGPRGLALVMIGLGVGGLTLALVEYRRQMADIRTQYRSYGPFPRSAVTAVGATLAGLGTIGLVLVVLRL